MFFRNEYWFLSNMYPCKIRVNGLEFKCAEACFQSFKTTDTELRAKFQHLNGFEAKKLGKKIKLRPDWNDIRLEVMRRVVYAKFHQNPELQKLLADVQGWCIVEDNTWHDTFWGKCDGVGENWLGCILTAIRTYVRNNTLRCCYCQYRRDDQADYCIKYNNFAAEVTDCNKK